jgi:hypothetical protein
MGRTYAETKPIIDAAKKEKLAYQLFLIADGIAMR